MRKAASQYGAFYADLRGADLENRAVVGIEATGAMRWFLEWLKEKDTECGMWHFSSNHF
jgi:hypothetical protein